MRSMMNLMYKAKSVFLVNSELLLEDTTTLDTKYHYRVTLLIPSSGS